MIFLNVAIGSDSAHYLNFYFCVCACLVSDKSRESCFMSLGEELKHRSIAELNGNLSRLKIDVKHPDFLLA